MIISNLIHVMPKKELIIHNLRFTELCNVVSLSAIFIICLKYAVPIDLNLALRVDFSCALFHMRVLETTFRVVFTFRFFSRG